MRVDDEVDLRRVDDGAETLDVVGLEVVPLREEGPALVIADARVQNDRQLASLEHEGLADHPGVL